MNDGKLYRTFIAACFGIIVGAQAKAAVQQQGAIPTVSVVVSAEIPKRQPVTIQWSVSGVPDTSSVGLFLQRDLPPRPLNVLPHRTLPGVAGPLTIFAQDLNGATNGSLVWDGNSVGCSPLDAPTFCRGVEPGQYRIEAVVYDVPRALLAGMAATQGRVVARGSVSVVISGEYDLDPLRVRLATAAAKRVRDLMIVPFGEPPFGAPVARYVRPRGDLVRSRIPPADTVKPDPTAEYCQIFDLQPPASGVLRACGTLHYRDETAIGDVQLNPAVMSFADASSKALALVDPIYLPRSADVGGQTHLLSQPRDWAYRPDGDYWLVAIFAANIGPYPMPEPFTVTALVRVDARGACFAETRTDLNGGTPAFAGVDLQTAVVTCP